MTKNAMLSEVTGLPEFAIILFVNEKGESVPGLHYVVDESDADAFLEKFGEAREGHMGWKRFEPQSTFLKL